MIIKRQRGTKRCVVKRKLKFHTQKNCLKAAQIKNIMNYLEEKGTNDSLKEDLKNSKKKKKANFKNTTKI